ncbi:glycosyltransferase, partial [Candidatus Pacearchaeota archaeon]|nr:glycosyltransferase [Candidatus Pacearchaeota archaeon]
MGYVDEIVIVDTGSTDGTQYLIKGWQKACTNGTRIVYDEYEWHDDFSAARNYSMSKVESDWIFIVDADDRINIDHWDPILKVLKSNDSTIADYDLIAVNILNVYGEKATIESRLMQPRFFRRSSGPEYIGKVHNNAIFPKLERPANAVKSEFEIFHIGYGMLSDEALVKKTERVIEMTKKSIEDFPDSAYELCNYANALKSSLANKDLDEESRDAAYKEAFWALGEAMTHAKTNETHIFINAVSLKGWLHYSKQELEQADHCASTVLKERPDHIDSLLLRGFANADNDNLIAGEYWLKRYLSEHEKLQTVGKYDYVSCEYAGYKAEAYKVLAAIEYRRRDTVDRHRALRMR